MTVTSTSRPGRIREQRKAAGLTQAELAIRAGCSVQYVRQLEAGCIPRQSRVLPDVLHALETSNAAVGSGDVAKTRDGGARHAES